MVLYLLSQAEANANAKRVSATDNPYLAQIAQARAATIDRREPDIARRDAPRPHSRVTPV